MKKLAFLLLIVAAWYFGFQEEVVTLGPGVTAPDAPQQKPIDAPVSFPFNDYTITPLAKFSIRAKVLSREEYSIGREAELSPLDLALGWGRMSDEDVLKDIEITQSGRWYRWRTRNFPISRQDIEEQSANMHLIPANEHVEDMMDEAHRGELVEFSGSLVRVEADDGWRWISSLSRTDTGARSCEVVWVESFSVVEYD
ncbi:MAG: hypothetical protein ABW078_11980 [Sedimenticola sp.]